MNVVRRFARLTGKEMSLVSWYRVIILSDPRRWSPIPMAARSKAWVCSRWHAGIAGSNSAGGMDVCVF